MDENTEQQKTGGMNRLLIVGLIAIVGVAAYMLFLNQPQTSETTSTEETESMVEQPTTGVTEANTTNTTSEENDVVTIEMEAGSFYYSQKEIRVKKGQTVRINFKAVDMMHDFNIDELQVDGPVVKSGESMVVEFVADQVGEFEYYCSVGQHRANGQIGKLIVE